MATTENTNRNIWEEKIADLRRHDLDALEGQLFDPTQLVSWPVPGLTFVRIDGILRSWDIEREKQQSSQPPQQNQDPNQVPKRMYLMEDAITGLGAQKSNIAFLVLGSKTGVNYYLGASSSAAPDTENNGQVASAAAYGTLKSILHSVYNGVDIHPEPFSADSIKTMIATRDNYIGVVTGFPALKSTAGDTIDSEQIERLSNGLRGHDFGLLVLAVPIPKSLVTAEDFLVVDQIQKAQENEDPEKKRRIKYYLDLEDAYLKHIQLGGAVGAWQVGTYFFAQTKQYLAVYSL